MYHQKVNFNLSTLNQLVASDNSCVFCHKDCSRSLILFPYHLGNLKSAIREKLNSQVTTYDPQLDGIILAYKNVKALNSIKLTDTGGFRIDLKADIYLFKPTIGSILTGVINKKSNDVVNCLVHSIFNVVIHNSKLNKDEDFDPNLNSKLQFGSIVKCSVLFINFRGRLPYIRAKLVSSEDYDCDNVDGQSLRVMVKQPMEEEMEVSVNSFQEITNGLDDTPKRKKSKKEKRKRHDSDTNDGDLMRSPKKRKKRDSGQLSDAQVLSSPVEVIPSPQLIDLEKEKLRIKEEVMSSLCDSSTDDGSNILHKKNHEAVESNNSTRKKHKKKAENDAQVLSSPIEVIPSSQLIDLEKEKLRIKEEVMSSLYGSSTDDGGSNLREKSHKGDESMNSTRKKHKKKAEKDRTSGDVIPSAQEDFDLEKEITRIKEEVVSSLCGSTDDDGTNLLNKSESKNLSPKKQKKKKKKHKSLTGDDDYSSSQLESLTESLLSQELKSKQITISPETSTSAGKTPKKIKKEKELLNSSVIN